jgi:hypothetical protein
VLALGVDTVLPVVQQRAGGRAFRHATAAAAVIAAGLPVLLARVSEVHRAARTQEVRHEKEEERDTHGRTHRSRRARHTAAPNP